MKFTGVLAALVGVVGLSASANAAINFGVTLQVDQVNHTWTAFGQLTGTTVSSTKGLHGFSIDVIGAGGAVVTNSTTNDAPTGLFFDGTHFWTTGFTAVKTIGTNGIDIHAAQSNDVSQSPDFAGQDNIVEKVALAAGPDSNANFAFPVQLAHGTYTGSTGTLTVQTAPGLVTLLPSTIPTTGTMSTFSPDTTSGQIVPLASVPEPASLSLLALGGVALLARRRKA